MGDTTSSANQSVPGSGEGNVPLSSAFNQKSVTHSPTQRALRRFMRNRLALFSMAMLVLLILVAIFAPFIAPYNPTRVRFDLPRHPPSAENLLGTDNFGRDVLSRIIWGARVSVTVGLVSVTIFETIAILLGSISAYYSGWVDTVIQRFVDIVMCFPNLIIILFFIAVLGPSIYNVMFAIGILSWPGPQRLFRGQILSLREMDYVVAARCIGARDGRIITRHILPGIVSPLVVNATFGVAAAILAEAGLSFLGLGVQPPTPSWGNMLTDAQNITILMQMPWLWLPPGVSIVTTVLLINFIGDGLRDALDPRQLGG
ncbi:MAG: ABC transporter permease [Chloroflexi bacterium]|nr:ABC transporter permease [Chloroflexota bacterium]